MSADVPTDPEPPSTLGRVLVGSLRFVVVTAAVAVPAHVLWTHRDVALPSFGTVAAASTPQPGWASLVLGAPSGAPERPLPELEPPPQRAGLERTGDERSSAGPDPNDARRADERPEVERPEDDGARSEHRPFLPAPPPIADGSERRAEPPAPESEPPLELRTFPDDFEIRVERNLTLGEIAQAHYGTSRPSVVKALAAYNGLDDPNKLRAGRTLRVPDRGKLGLD
ncbi:hypothetical protein Pla163_29810 [Planctomycetes bacterium Pla163]|uniref:LysM domain-containing protein n=1 Tax=Rohdeia mirabilis TaxID=2528008 RepID=A0A518D2Y9_9BACT|nr:hypothetical protein Pla163_29810 [Planctomycetes bacterium Pla163]